MPAIQLDRLKAQVSQIGDEIMQPASFIRRLHDLLDFYADRTRRPGQARSHTPRLPHYNTPAPVIRELQRDLSARAWSAGPAALMSLADALWADGGFEMRLLAAHLISREEIQSTEVISRLERWIRPDEDSQVVITLLENGYSGISRAQPQSWLNLVKAWLAVDRTASQALGLQALSLVIRDPGYENFPQVFSLISPIVQSAPVSLFNELTSLLRLLAGRTPAETVFFLRQSLSISPSRNIPRLVRRCLPFFDPTLQQTLREALAARPPVE